uniref:Uncharacterized protein n=1 Tax=Citrus limon TaxID=2708 RepID=A0A1S8ACW2_CITLI
MAAAAASALTLFVVTFAVILNTTAADPEMLQDVCVADLDSRGLVSSSILWAHKITGQEHFPGQQLLFTDPLPKSPNQEDKNFLFHELSAEATLHRNCWCDNTNALLMFKE